MDKNNDNEEEEVWEEVQKNLGVQSFAMYCSTMLIINMSTSES